MLSDKKLAKIEKLLGKQEIEELDSLSPEQLKAKIVQANSVIKNVIDALEADEKYQQLKESLKALSSGAKEVKSRHNCIIQYCLHNLEEKGQE